MIEGRLCVDQGIDSLPAVSPGGMFRVRAKESIQDGARVKCKSLHVPENLAWVLNEKIPSLP